MTRQGFKYNIIWSNPTNTTNSEHKKTAKKEIKNSIALYQKTFIQSQQPRCHFTQIKITKMKILTQKFSKTDLEIISISISLFALALEIKKLNKFCRQALCSSKQSINLLLLSST